MGSTITWMPLSILTRVLKLTACVIGILSMKLIWRAYTIRRKFREVRSQGIPMLPHSWITGHLGVMAEFRKEYPGDINIGNFHPWIINNYKKYFPEMDHCPPVIHLDLWPLLKAPIMVAYNSSVAAQFTQINNLDKHQISLDFMTPLTKGKDIATLQSNEWKKWRGWFNPGFSSRNVSTMVPELIEEIQVFSKNLEERAGPNGTWGPMFQLRNATTALTFDIIVRAVLDERLHEQTNPAGGPLRVALADQLRLMGIRQAFSLGYLFPWQNKAVDRNNQIVHDQLYPNIVRSLRSGFKPSNKKTVVSLALMHLAEEAGGKDINPATDPEMMETIISNLKTFLVAGHETTASALCFMFKVLQDNPVCMAKVRAEHDEVLGPDPDQAAEMIGYSPQLLNSLRYTHAVIKETLRIYQMASTMRGGEPGFYLSDPSSGMQYPTEGFLVWDGGPGMQLDPLLWPHVDQFIPDRWLVPADHRLHPIKDTWRAFARGPRDCIGQEIALVEIKLVAALIIRKFDIEEAWDDWDTAQGNKSRKDMVRGQRLYVAGDGIGHPKDGMPVRVRLRETETKE
ncbi:vera protein [Colletotrichum zoysiae]|uniref:Vera protein n=1 Tax=Colletotrichum zoysiae TaxID=1216348 RepID=A0AAD9HHP0_9PEZI|nr:vera protein [Colletotrichum zoysiae]